jgi:hypothetical protein
VQRIDDVDDRMVVGRMRRGRILRILYVCADEPAHDGADVRTDSSAVNDADARADGVAETDEPADNGANVRADSSADAGPDARADFGADVGAKQSTDRAADCELLRVGGLRVGWRHQLRGRPDDVWVDL